jgi:hypothetical protein
MPSKGTTIRNVRVPQDLWDAALSYAEETDTNVSDAIREFLRHWVDGKVRYLR